MGSLADEVPPLFRTRADLHSSNKTSAEPDSPGWGLPTAGLTWGRARDLLVTIPGIGPHTAEQVLAMIGIDMTLFPSPSRLASWAGLTPRLNESAGQHHPSRCRPGDIFLKGALRQAARSAAGRRPNRVPVTYFN